MPENIKEGLQRGDTGVIFGDVILSVPNKRLLSLLAVHLVSVFCCAQLNQIEKIAMVLKLSI